jgi:hypothetical protein
MNQWEGWFHQLERTGDADPGLASRMAEAQATCVQALSDLGVAMSTFRMASPEELLQQGFPQAPWPGLNPPWQQDEVYRQQMRELLSRDSWHRLFGELAGFLQMLETAPSTGFILASTPTGKAASANDEAQVKEAGAQASEEELTDRQRLILETMLEHEITSERRRKRRAEIVGLINRKHNPDVYARDFAALVKQRCLQSLEGPSGGMWLTPEGKAAAKRLRTENEPR